LKKKYSFGKKIKSAFKGLKSLKMTKKYFWQKFKNETCPKALFDLKKFIFQMQS
jgi:hypothetical protein